MTLDRELPIERENRAVPRGLQVVDIYKRFRKRTVLKGLSMEVREGELVGLLGPDGAGKTTCFQAILGLIKPDSGRILLDGTEITFLPTYRRAMLGLGYLPQEPCVFRGLTVEANIEALLEISEPEPDERGRRLEQLLHDFHLDHLRNRSANFLSGGERRRCEIVRALATNPSIILLDEPFAGIDPLTIIEIADLIRAMKATGVGVLITDQNVYEMLRLIERAYVLIDGHVMFEGQASELLEDETVKRLYLGGETRRHDFGSNASPDSSTTGQSPRDGTHPFASCSNSGVRRSRPGTE